VNLGTTRAKGEVDMEITLRRMQHKEARMQPECAQAKHTHAIDALFHAVREREERLSQCSDPPHLLTIGAGLPAYASAVSTGTASQFVVDGASSVQLTVYPDQGHGCLMLTMQLLLCSLSM